MNKVNRKKVIELLKQGVHYSEIATKHLEEIRLDPKITRLSRQSIYLIQQDAIKKGELKTGRHKLTDIDKLTEITKPDLTEIGFLMYEKAVNYDRVKAENYKLANINASLQNTIRQLEEAERQRKQDELRLEAIKKNALVVHGD